MPRRKRVPRTPEGAAEAIVKKSRSKTERARRHGNRLGKASGEKKRSALRRVSNRDREIAEEARLAVTGKSAGGILVASAAPPAFAYLRIRKNGTGEIVKSLAVESPDPRHLGQVLTHGTQGIDMREHHVDDSEVEGTARARRIVVPR